MMSILALTMQGGIAFMHDDGTGGDARVTPLHEMACHETRLAGYPYVHFDRKDTKRRLRECTHDFIIKFGVRPREPHAQRGEPHAHQGD